MAKLQVLKGATSVLVRIFIQDSISTTGAGKTGLTSTSFTGTKVYVARDDDGNAGGTAVTITDSTRGTWSSGGIKEKDATNMPGVYEFGLTNASLASGSRSCTYLFIGSGIAPLPLEIELTGVDNQDAIHGGMSALPNTACTTNASLLTSGTGTDQLSVSSGKILLQATQSGVTIPTVTTVTNQLTAAAIATGIWQDTTSSDFTVSSSIGKSLYTSGAVPGAAGGLFIAGTNAATVITTSLTTHIIGTVDTVTTYTGNTPQTGDSFARLGAPVGASISADIAEIEADTDLITAGVTVSDITATALSKFFLTDSTTTYASAVSGSVVKEIVTNVTGTAPTAAAVATAVWQDTTSGDFTVASSIGKSLYTSGNVPGAANGLFIAGTNAATVITTSLTTHIIGTVDTVTTYTGNTPQTGDSFARLGAPVGASISADIAEIEAEVDTIAAGTSDPWVTSLPGSYSSGQAGFIIGTYLTGNSFTRLGAPVGASISADIAEIEADTDLITTGVTVSDITATALSKFFLTDSTTTYASAVSGSVVKEIVTNVSGSAPTAAQVATAVWQDTTSGDFNVSNSIGKSLYTSGAVPGAAGGLFIAGTNAATVITTSLTTHIIGTVDTVTTVTNQLTAAAIATAIWQDTTSGDFTVTSSPGKILVSQLGGAFSTTSSSVFSTASLVNAPTGSGASAADIATAVWQDTTSGDFTVSGSIGKSLFTSGAVPGAAGGLFIAGTNAATVITTSLTTHLIGTVDTVTTVTNQLTAASITANILAAAIPLSNTDNTVADCLNAARAQGFGKWVIDTMAKTLTMYGPNESTIVHTFDLDSVVEPTTRTKH